MIRFVFRWVFRFVLLAVVLLIGLLLLKDTLTRSFVEQQIRRKTGFDTKLGRAQVNLLDSRLTLENLTLYNPAEYGGSPFFDAPDLHVEYVPSELARGRVHFKFMRLNIRELNVVEANGKTNLLELLRTVVPPARAERKSGAPNGQGSYQFNGIDLLNLSVGRITFADLRRPKRNQEIKVDVQNQLIQNVRSEEDFANILLKLLFRSGFTIYVDDHPPARPKRSP